MIRLETERLIIRDHVSEDLENHHKLMSDQEVMTYLQDIMTRSLEDSKKNLQFSILQSKQPNRKHYFFAIEEKDGDYVGSIGFTILEADESHGNAELGYFILKSKWGQGYTYEAAKRVIDFAFHDVKLHKMTAGCNAENLASENIMKKLGMKKEAHKVKHLKHKGQWNDRVEYGILR